MSRPVEIDCSHTIDKNTQRSLSHRALDDLLLTPFHSVVDWAVACEISVGKFKDETQ